jgi:hypothetical protein
VPQEEIEEKIEIENKSHSQLSRSKTFSNCISLNGGGGVAESRGQISPEKDAARTTELSNSRKPENGRPYIVRTNEFAAYEETLAVSLVLDDDDGGGVLAKDGDTEDET